MSQSFGELQSVVARKQYRCEWCFEPIFAGERHQQFKGKFEGDWQNWRMHNECSDDYGGDPDGFTPGCAMGNRPAKERP